jgi:hypothetical protein
VGAGRMGAKRKKAKGRLIENYFEVELLVMDFLRDPSWQFWGFIIGVLAILVSIGIYLLQRNNKRLAYSLLTVTPLLSVNDEIRGKIKIKYGRKNIQNIHLVLLKIENNGNVAIPSSDYEKPITFLFEDSEILSIEVVEVSPKNLKPTITAELSRFTVDRILLNKKDYLVIKLLFSNYASKIDVDTRILGVKEIQRFERKNELRREQRLIIEALMVMFLLSVILTIESDNTILSLFPWLIAGISMLLLVVYAYFVLR